MREVGGPCRWIPIGHKHAVLQDISYVPSQSSPSQTEWEYFDLSDGKVKA